jgi:hypothetical protein
MKNPFMIAGAFLVALAIAMVAFYKMKERSVETDTPISEAAATTEQNREASPYDGTYSSADGALEHKGKRITFFQVAQRETGVFGAFARVETVGVAEASVDVECQDVKLSETEFFLRCSSEAEGSISFEATGVKPDKPDFQVSGRILWAKAGESALDGTVRLSHMP